MRGTSCRDVGLLLLDGLEDGSCCGLEDRKRGVLRGDPERPVFIGDRAAGGGK